MAKYSRVRYYGNNPSVHTPVFCDLNRYLPQPHEGSVFSPLKRRYPKPITAPSVYKVLGSDDHSTSKTTSSSATKSTATSRKTADLGPIEMNVTHQQRTTSVSSGEELYNTSGQDTVRRPVKRRHHSATTPGLQDEVPVEAKRAKRNYSTSTARLLRFHPLDVEPPVFTLDTVSCSNYCSTCTYNLSTSTKATQQNSLRVDTLGRRK